MNDITTISINDAAYPPALKEIHNAPRTLYVRGTLPARDALALAVVGTRTPSAYGKQITPGIVRELVRHGATIVSGLALGIDGIAHEATLASGGVTVAVLGSGIDDASIYPPSHKTLARRILESGGALISEYAPGTTPERFHFPERNRIIAGLSRGVLIIEAKEKSGALITATLALKENRDVFAVPGPITSEHSRGPNRLLREGAKAVLDAYDILEEYGIYTAADTTNEQALSENERAILKLLADGPRFADELSAATGRAPAELTTTLVALELAGRIINLGGGRFGTAS